MENTIQSIKDKIQSYVDDSFDPEDEIVRNLTHIQTYIFQLLQNIEENSAESSYESSTC